MRRWISADTNNGESFFNTNKIFELLIIFQALKSLNLRRSCEPKISIAKAVSLWKVVYQGGGERSSRGPDL